jgi:hypothetical protein
MGPGGFEGGIVPPPGFIPPNTNVQTSSRLSGLVALQVKAEDIDLPFFRKTIFSLQNAAKTCDELLGGDLSNLGGGFIYAGQIDFNELIPEATKVANRHKGNVTYAAVPDMGPLDPINPNASGGLTLNELIADASSTKATSRPFLKSAVVNNSVITEALDPSFTPDGVQDNRPFASEIVNYIVIQTASKSLVTEPGVTSANLPYDITGAVRANMVFWPDPTDAITHALFKNNASTTYEEMHGPKAHSTLPHATEGIDPRDHSDVSATKGNSFGERFKGFMGKAYKKGKSYVKDHWKEWAVHGLESAAMLMAPNPVQQYDHSQFNKVDIRRIVRKMLTVA